MSKSGLFAGQITEDAPVNGAVTLKQNGYHWFEWSTPPSPLLDDLIGYWGLDESSGKVRLNAVYGGAVFIPVNPESALNRVGIIKNAVHCAHGDPLLDPYLAHDSSDFDFGDESWFISIWIRDYEDTGSRVIIGDYNEPSGNGSWTLKNYASSPTYGYQFIVTGPLGTTVLNGTAAGGSGEWRHIVAWHDAENDEIGMSVNDQVIPDIAPHIGGLIPNNELGLGWTHSTSVYYGGIDELAIWKGRLLSASDITALYGGGGGLAYPFGGYVSEPPGYAPMVMTFEGAGYYSDSTVNTSGNLVTGIVKVGINKFYGAGDKCLLDIRGAASHTRLLALIYADDHADAALRNKVRIIVQDNTGGFIGLVLSTVDITDGQDHVIFMAYDADNATVLLYVDGVDADDIGYANRSVTVGILDGGSSSYTVGASMGGTSKMYGEIGYFGIKDAYLTNPLDFYDPIDGLQNLDEVGWTEWGSQPSAWNEHGEMSDNKGSMGNMTVNGTITGPS